MLEYGVPPIQVTAAVLEKDGKILLARRAQGHGMSGLWEFPGGKLEPGETLRECLAREIHEELGIGIEVGREVARSVHAYARGSIELIAFSARQVRGEIVLKDHDSVEWVEKARLLDYDLAPADIPIARALAGRQEPRQAW